MWILILIFAPLGSAPVTTATFGTEASCLYAIESVAVAHDGGNHNVRRRAEFIREFSVCVPYNSEIKVD
jgi:hypothetical protein